VLALKERRRPAGPILLPHFPPEAGTSIENWKGLDRQSVTLPRLLQGAGYRTIHVGKAHMGPVGSEGANPVNLGFDVNVAGCAIGRPKSYSGKDGYGEDDLRQPPHLEAHFGLSIHWGRLFTSSGRSATESSFTGRSRISRSSHSG